MTSSDRLNLSLQCSREKRENESDSSEMRRLSQACSPQTHGRPPDRMLIVLETTAVLPMCPDACCHDELEDMTLIVGRSLTLSMCAHWLGANPLSACEMCRMVSK